ncbi:MAG: Conserved exported protein of unknown function [Rickettsiales bacterium]|jgi:hypothetical protein|nr:Conserved exported protein of unknown function [Rickettsiales bacterium]
MKQYTMNQKRMAVRTAAFLLILGFSSSAEARERSYNDTNIKDDKFIFSATLENDLFAGRDDGYTNGVRFAWLSPEKEIPGWIEESSHIIPLSNPQGHKRYTFSLGQAMFAPDNLHRTDLIREDRPYAGFTYGSVGLVTDSGNRLDNFQLTLGVVGPSSKAEESQKIVHHVVGSPHPMGWHHQLKDEPGIMLSYERIWRNIYDITPTGWGLDIDPHIRGDLGNVFTDIATGITMRIGYDLPSDYGPPLIRPNLPGSDFFVPTKKVGWYVFGGVEGAAVAQNIFLDGNTWKSSHHVDKKPFIGSAQAGIALTYKNARIAYTHIFRTKEFDGQSRADQFGGINVSFRY